MELFFYNNCYRKNKTTMDQLVLHSIWKSSAKNPNNITITGLLIEGATFNGSSLTACTATSETITAVPDCNIVWMDKVSVFLHFC